MAPASGARAAPPAAAGGDPWHLGKGVGTALLFVLGAVTLAIWLTQALRFVDLIVNRGLPIETFLHLAALLLPQFFQLVLPIASISVTAVASRTHQP